MDSIGLSCSTVAAALRCKASRLGYVTSLSPNLRALQAAAPSAVCSKQNLARCSPLRQLLECSPVLHCHYDEAAAPHTLGVSGRNYSRGASRAALLWHMCRCRRRTFATFSLAQLPLPSHFLKHAASVFLVLVAPVLGGHRFRCVVDGLERPVHEHHSQRDCTAPL